MTRVLTFCAVLLLIPAHSLSAWVGHTRLTRTPDESALSGGAGHPVQATLGGDVHIVWHDYGSGGNPQIYWKKFSRSSGWQDSARISLGAGPALYPAATLDGNGSLHVFWRDRRAGQNEIYYRFLSPRGEWSGSDTTIVSLSFPGASYTATSDSEGNVFLFWSDSKEGWFRVYFKKRSVLTGWETGESSVSENPTGSTASVPCASIDAFGNAHLVWMDDRDGNFEIYYRCCFKSSGWETQPTRLTNDTGTSLSPSVASDGLGNVHVVWSDWRVGYSQVYYRKKSLGAPQWGRERQLSNGSGNATNAALIGDNEGSIFVAWEDNRNTGIGSEIYFRSFTADGGLDILETRVTLNYGSSWYPSLSADGSGNLHLVWADNSNDSNLEIYYAMGQGMAAVGAETLTLDGIPRGEYILLRWNASWSPLGRMFGLMKRNDGGSFEPLLARETFGGENGEYRDFQVVRGSVYEYTAYLKDMEGRYIIEKSASVFLPLEKEFLRVFPNPTRGKVTFAFSAGEKDAARLLIHDAYGRLVNSFQIPSKPNEMGRFDWAIPDGDFPSGVYFAVLLSGEKRVEKKFVYIK